MGALSWTRIHKPLVGPVQFWYLRNAFVGGIADNVHRGTGVHNEVELPVAKKQSDLWSLGLGQHVHVFICNRVSSAHTLL